MSTQGDIERVDVDRQEVGYVGKRPEVTQAAPEGQKKVSIER